MKFRIDRKELDDALREPLERFVDVLAKELTGNGIRDLCAVVGAGGGANISAITTTLSDRFRVPVITTLRPHLAAATGAALWAAHGPVGLTPAGWLRGTGSRPRSPSAPR